MLEAIAIRVEAIAKTIAFNASFSQFLITI